MTKLTSKLVAAKVKGEPGSFADGNGLYLVVPKRGEPIGHCATPHTQSVNK